MTICKWERPTGRLLSTLLGYSVAVSRPQGRSDDLLRGARESPFRRSQVEGAVPLEQSVA